MSPSSRSSSRASAAPTEAGEGGGEVLDPSAAARERLRGHIALVVVQVLFGLFPFFAKLALEVFEPRAIVAWRILVATLVLGAAAVVLHGRAVLPSRAELPRIAICAVLGVVLNQVLFVEGMSHTTAVDAGVLMTSIPVFTFLFAVLAGQERFRLPRALGIAVALAGVLLLAGRELSELDLGPQHRMGNLLILVNCASYALYLVVARPLLAKRPPLVVIAWVYTFALWSVPPLALTSEMWPSAVEGVAGADETLLRAVQGLAYIIVFPTIVAYLLNTFALARVRASTTAVYIYLQPLVACTTGVLWLNESLPPAVLLAAICLFVGIWLVARVSPDRSSAIRVPR